MCKTAIAFLTFLEEISTEILISEVDITSIFIFFEANAVATKSFNTRSSLRFGLKPHAVANLKQVKDVFLKSFIFFKLSSVPTLLFAYAVSGFNTSFSFLGESSPKPYTEHEDAKTKLLQQVHLFQWKLVFLS